MKTRLAILLLALGFVSTTPAAAQTTTAERRANESFKQARSAFARKDYAAAAAAFEQAARFRPHPAPLLNAAEAWELAGEHARAAEDCDAVLAMKDVDATFSKEAQERLAKLSGKIGTLKVSKPKAALVTVDGGPQSVVPVVRRLTPGSHQVAVTDPASGERREFVIDLVAGSTHELASAEPPGAGEPKTAPTPIETPKRREAPKRSVVADKPEKKSGVPTATWIFYGGAAAAVVVASVGGFLTLKARDDFDERPTEKNADRFDRMKLITNVSLAVAAGAAITGTVIWMTSSSDSVGVVASHRFW